MKIDSNFPFFPNDHLRESGDKQPINIPCDDDQLMVDPYDLDLQLQSISEGPEETWFTRTGNTCQCNVSMSCACSSSCSSCCGRTRTCNGCQ